VQHQTNSVAGILVVGFRKHVFLLKSFQAARGKGDALVLRWQGIGARGVVGQGDETYTYDIKDLNLSDDFDSPKNWLLWTTRN